MHRYFVSKIVRAWIALCGTAVAAGDLSFELHCGRLADLNNAYGPYDYSNPDHFSNKLRIVEKHHFTRNVEFLVKGETGRLIGDIDYTLRAFPNHYKALDAVGRLELRDGLDATLKPATCYFDRAIKFRPRDANTYVVYGIYLYKAGNNDAAIEKLLQAVKLAPNSSEANYNLGLILHAAGQSHRAAMYAAEARRLGFPLDGLIKKLKEAGYWPPAESGDDSSTAATVGDNF